MKRLLFFVVFALALTGLPASAQQGMTVTETAVIDLPVLALAKGAPLAIETGPSTQASEGCSQSLVANFNGVRDPNTMKVSGRWILSGIIDCTLEMDYLEMLGSLYRRGSVVTQVRDSCGLDALFIENFCSSVHDDSHYDCSDCYDKYYIALSTELKAPPGYFFVGDAGDDCTYDISRTTANCFFRSPEAWYP